MSGKIAGNVEGLQPPVLSALQQAMAELDKVGILYSIPLRGAFRTRADQEALYADRANNPNPVGKPGSSNHERGTAVDISFGGGSTDQARSILAQHGFQWKGAGDPVHYDYRGPGVSKNTSAPANTQENPFTAAAGGGQTTAGPFSDAAAGAATSQSFGPFSDAAGSSDLDQQIAALAGSSPSDAPPLGGGLGTERLSREGTPSTLPPQVGLSGLSDQNISNLMAKGASPADLEKLAASLTQFKPAPEPNPSPPQSSTPPDFSTLAQVGAQVQRDLASSPGTLGGSLGTQATTAPRAQSSTPFSDAAAGPVPSTEFNPVDQFGNPLAYPHSRFNYNLPEQTTSSVLGHAMTHPSEIPGALWGALGQAWGAGSAAMTELAHIGRTQGPLAFVPMRTNPILTDGPEHTLAEAHPYSPLAQNVSDILHAAGAAFQDWGHPAGPGAVTEALGGLEGAPRWVQNAAHVGDFAVDILGNPLNLAFSPIGEFAGNGLARVGARVLETPAGQALAQRTIVPAMAARNALGEAVSSSRVGQFLANNFPRYTTIGKGIQQSLSAFRGGVETDSFQVGNVIRDMQSRTQELAAEDPIFKSALESYTTKPPANAAGPGPLQDLVMRSLLWDGTPEGAQAIEKLAAEHHVPMDDVAAFHSRLEQQAGDLYKATGGIPAAWETSWQPLHAVGATPAVPFEAALRARQEFILDKFAPGLFVKVGAGELGQIGSQAFASNGIPAILEPRWSQLTEDLNNLRSDAVERLGNVQPRGWKPIPDEPFYGELAGKEVPPQIARIVNREGPLVQQMLKAAADLSQAGPKAAVPQASDYGISQLGALIKKISAGVQPIRTAAGMAQRVGQTAVGLYAEGGAPLPFARNVASAYKEIGEALGPGGKMSPELEEFTRNAPGFFQTEFKTLGLQRAVGPAEIAGAGSPRTLGPLGGASALQSLGEKIPNLRTRQDQILQYALYRTLLPVVRDRLQTALENPRFLQFQGLGLQQAGLLPGQGAVRAAGLAPKVTADFVGNYLFDYSHRRLEQWDRLGLEEIGDALRVLHVMPGVSAFSRLLSPNTTKMAEMLVNTAIRHPFRIFKAAGMNQAYARNYTPPQRRQTAPG